MILEKFEQRITNIPDNDDDNDNNKPKNDIIQLPTKTTKSKRKRTKKCIEKIMIEKIINEFIDSNIIRTNNCSDFVTVKQMIDRYNEFAISKQSSKVGSYHLRPILDNIQFILKEVGTGDRYVCVKFK